MDSKNALVYLTQKPILPSPCIEFLRAGEGGAIDLFLGTTRRFTKRDDAVEETELLEYEAAEELAIAELHRIIALAEAQWPIIRVVLIHRLGVVPSTEISVLIGVATAHRKASFDACSFLIEELKVSAPIWKKEVYTDGNTSWVDGDTRRGERSI
jgi:molybdopterin synthase catalytic subunit